MGGQWANVNGKWVRKGDGGESADGAASSAKAPIETADRGPKQPSWQRRAPTPPVPQKEVRELLCPASKGVNEGFVEPSPKADHHHANIKKEAAASIASTNPSLPAVTMSAKAAAKATTPVARLGGSFPGGLPRLVQILRDSAADDDGKEEVCKKIANLCSFSPSKSSLVHDALAKEGAVEALAELARTTRGQNLQQLAIKAIGRVCDGHEESQVLAWDAGCVDVLIDCLRNGSCETKEVSSSALIHLSKAPEKLIKASKLSSPNGLSLIIGLIKYAMPSEPDMKTCENCAWILGNISCHRSLQTQIRVLSGVPSLIYLLEAATAQEHVTMCYRAVWSLCNLASDRKCQNEIRTCNGIPMLVLQLDALNWEAGKKNSNHSNSDHMKLVQTVSHILSNLAVDPRNQQELLDAGAIPLLMRLIDMSMNAKVRLMASWALSNLAANPRTHHALHRADAVPNFTDLLAASTGDHWVTLRMVVAIGNLACDNAENRDMIREFGAIRLLVDNLGTSDRDLQERVCIAIENLTTDNPANQRMIINCGAAGHLKLIIGNGSSVTAQEKAIGIIYNLCGNEYCLQEVWACGVVSALEALASGDIDPKEMGHKDGGKTLQERAEHTLQRLVPSRGGILPELQLTMASKSPSGVLDVTSSNGLARSMRPLPPQKKLSRAERLQGAFRRMCTCIMPCGNCCQADMDCHVVGNGSSRGTMFTQIPYINPLRQSQQLPTWDLSFVPEHGELAGEKKNGDMQVWDVQNLTVYCQPTPRYKDGEDDDGAISVIEMDDEPSYMFDMQRSQCGIDAHLQEIFA